MTFRRMRLLVLIGLSFSTLYSLQRGIWSDRHHLPGTVWYFAIGAFALIALALVTVLPRLGSQFEMTSSVELRADREAANGWARRALEEPARGARVASKWGTLTVHTPPTKPFGRVQSIGEEIAVTIREAPSGSIAQIQSRYRTPMGNDSGKNRENVDEIANELVRLDAQSR